MSTQWGTRSEKEAEWFKHRGQRQNLRTSTVKNGLMWVAYLTCISKVMSGLGICQGIYHAPWPLGSRGVCLNVRGSCYLQRPVNGQLESWPQDMRPCQFPRNVPRPWDHDNLGGMGCHQNHGDVLTWNAAGGLLGISDPAVAGSCVDVCVSCHY